MNPKSERTFSNTAFDSQNQVQSRARECIQQLQNVLASTESYPSQLFHANHPSIEPIQRGPAAILRRQSDFFKPHKLLFVTRYGLLTRTLEDKKTGVQYHLNPTLSFFPTIIQEFLGHRQEQVLECRQCV